MSQTICELVIRIFFKFVLLQLRFSQRCQVTILHITRALSCRSICKNWDFIRLSFCTWEQHTIFFYLQHEVINSSGKWPLLHCFHLLSVVLLYHILPYKLNNSVNSLWPNDAIWRHRSGSTLTQVMACCLTTPNHHLNQCWRIISKDS